MHHGRGKGRRVGHEGEVRLGKKGLLTEVQAVRSRVKGGMSAVLQS